MNWRGRRLGVVPSSRGGDYARANTASQLPAVRDGRSSFPALLHSIQAISHSFRAIHQRTGGLMRKSVVLLLVISVATLGAASKTLDIYVIDVEGGNATLFVAPSGESVLIDTGNGATAATR